MSCPAHIEEAGNEAHQEGARVRPQQRALAVAERLREPAAAGSRRRPGVVRSLRRDPIGFFERLKREQGDVARARFGRSDFFLVSRPDLIKRIVASHARDYVREGFAYKSWRRAPQFAPPRGLLQPSADHDVHLRARRALQPVFRRRRVDAHWPDLLRMAEDGIAGWRDGEVVDVVTEARRLVLPLVSSVHFTQEIDLPMPELVAKLRTVADATVDATSWSLELRTRLLPRRIVEAADARQDVLDALARSIARTRRDGGTGDDDLFAVLVEIGDAEGLSDDDIVLEAFGHLLNSPDTTVSAFAWTMYLLATNPLALACARDELDAVAGEPSHADLPYTIAVLSESLRLYPPSWRLKRRALVEHELDGHRIRVGAHVWASPTIVHRDERWWRHADAFLPERWLGGPRPEPYTFMPFGGGNRKCLGEQLSWRTLTALLVAVLGRFDIAYAGASPAIPAAGSTLQPLGGMPVHLRRRRTT